MAITTDMLANDPALFDGLLGGDPDAAALALARLGLPVVPVHSVDAADRCTCGDGACRSAGKHPRARHGLRDATADPPAVAAAWRRWPLSNAAVLTGAAAGIWVLDADEGAGGPDALCALEAEHGDLPETWAVETGGGGLHFWFRHPGGTVPTSAGKVGPGIDVRGEGGYAVCPPSAHRSGRPYGWAAAWRPGLVPLAPAPPWLLALARRGRDMVPPDPIPYSPQDRGNDFARPIAEGGRNDALTRMAGAMRRRGFGEAAIRAALLEENAARCAPPLPEGEVARIAASVARYAPAPDLGVRAAIDRPKGFVEFVGGKAVRR